MTPEQFDKISAALSALQEAINEVADLRGVKVYATRQQIGIDEVGQGIEGYAIKASITSAVSAKELA